MIYGGEDHAAPAHGCSEVRRLLPSAGGTDGVGDRQSVGHHANRDRGILSALGRNVPEGKGGRVIFNAIQMDAPINPGNSGGALVDLRGDLVGIPTLTIVNTSFNTPASGVGFAIPANRAVFIVPQLIQTGKVTDPGLADLGLAGTTVDASVAAQLQLPITQGALITSVVANGSAPQAGLKAGDVIVRLNERAVTDAAALLDNVLNKRPDEQVTLQVYRGTQLATVNVTLGTSMSHNAEPGWHP